MQCVCVCVCVEGRGGRGGGVTADRECSFQEKICQIISWYPLWGWRPFLENPGSATDKALHRGIASALSSDEILTLLFRLTLSLEFSIWK